MDFSKEGQYHVSYAIRAEIIVRGPGYTGSESYDDNCIFGNYVEMNFNQMMMLRSIVEDLPRPKIKEYVCTITNTMVTAGQGYMEFSELFTAEFLKRVIVDSNAIRLGIPPRWDSVSVAVSMPTVRGYPKYCMMVLDVSGKAKIETGWTAVVNSFSLREKDVYMFSFFDDRLLLPALRDPYANIRLVIQKLEQDA